jgi:hypothetical protein
MSFNWQLLVNIAETGANVAEMALAPELLPVTQAGEAALNPILAKISAKQPVTLTDIAAFYGPEILALNLAKNGKDAATIAKIEEYVTAANNGAMAWVTTGTSFNATAEFTPVTPIVLPTTTTTTTTTTP